MLKNEPELPPGIRIYAIGDIHGCSILLEEAFRRIDEHLAVNTPARAMNVYLGDYIDRGPDSRGVINLILSRAEKAESVCLMGNHEELLLNVLRDPGNFKTWKSVGGLQTLASYGIVDIPSRESRDYSGKIQEFRNILPSDHLEFIKSLKSDFICGDYFFVHAGVRPGVPISEQQMVDLLRIREPFLSYDQKFEMYIVHGHSPTLRPDIRHNRANIDTGAYATSNLTVLAIEGTDRTVL